jgi:hypothetical protein
LLDGSCADHKAQKHTISGNFGGAGTFHFMFLLGGDMRLHSSRTRHSFASLLMLLVLAALLLAPSISFAQMGGAITGTVIDSSGAVVPNAKIILKNQASGDLRNTVSNDVGFFNFASVGIGTYTVRIEAASFKAWEQRDVAVSAGGRVNIADIKLEVGGGKEAVTVEAVASQVQIADSGERSALLSNVDINQLALVSRNVSELLKVLPGVTTVAQGNNGVGFDFKNAGASGSAVGVGLSSNGAPYRGGTAYNLDGVNIIDSGCNCWGIAVVNPDMTQEVKVQSSNFGADTAKGPVVVNAASKSGGEDFHGLAYFHARNAVLNANSWASNQSHSPRAAESYYYPGGSFGGPVLIPGTNFNKSKKLLFWFGYERFQQTLPSASPLQAYVPTADMIQGNFTPSANTVLCPNGFTAASGMCANPFAPGASFAPNGTPITSAAQLQSLLGPAAGLVSAIQNTWPTPNITTAGGSGYNFYDPVSSQHNGYQMRARVDYNFTDNTKLFVSYQYATDASETVSHIWYNPQNAIPFPGGLASPTKSKVATANFVHVFSPTLTNEFIASWGWLDNPFSANDLAKVTRASNFPYKDVFSTVSTMIPSVNSYNGMGLPDLSQPDMFSQAYDTRKANPAFSDNLTKVYRAHTLRTGFFTESTGNSQGTYGYTNTSVYFDPVASPSATNVGSVNPVVNLLLGIASYNPAGHNGGSGNAYTQNSTDPITNMAYRTTSAYLQDSWKVSHRLTVDMGLRFDHIGRWYDKSENSIGMAVWLPGRYASDLASGKALPGVYWHAIDPGIPNGGSPTRFTFVSPRLGFAYDLTGSGNTVIRGGFGAYRWNDQYNDYAGALQVAQGAKTFSTGYNSTVNLLNVASAQVGNSPSSVYATDPNDTEVPLTYAYNFTISHKTRWNSLLEIAYVGNQSHDLLMGGQSDGAGLAGGDFVNQNKIPLGGLFGKDPVTGAPAPANPANTGSYNFNDYLPYFAGYGTNFIRVPKHVGYSNYNGLQLSWLKRAGRATFDVNYTWSKALGILSSTMDAFNVHGNYGILNISRPHVINTSYAFDLGKLYHGETKVLGGFANGWTISGITTWQAGGNLQAISNNPSLGLNASTLTYFGTNVGMVLPITTCDPASGLNAQQFIKTSCLAAPAVGQQGDRTIAANGPAYFNSDLAVYKTFHIYERHKVEFRFSAFNFLNHPIWGFNNIGGAISIGNSGKADTKSGYRNIELGLKYSF